MADIKEFVINDRRKFTAEGELRSDAPPHPEKETKPQPSPRREDAPAPQNSTSSAPQAAAQPVASSTPKPEPEADSLENDLPAPTAEQAEQATRAYEATVERLDTALRATNPGMDPLPGMTFERVTQSLYMQALLQLGAAAEPGQQPQIDILGARQTIDMLAIIASKTAGNLSDSEQKLLDSALFESRMAFLEVTQALARQTQARQPGVPGSSGGPPPRPTIVR